MYDVIVCGGGPSGLTFSRYCGEKGFRVLALEKKRVIGEPRHDSGATYPETLSEHGLPKNVVANECNGVIFETPTKRIERKFKDLGYILKRRDFDRALAEKAVDAGVVIELGARVQEAVGGTVYYKKEGEMRTVEGRLVVEATGGENSVLAGQMGLSRATGRKTVTVEYEVFCTEFDDSSTAHHGLGGYAPQGYAWIYPTGERSAIVGCSQIEGTPSRVRETLKGFMKNVLEKRAVNPVPVEVHVCVNKEFIPEKTYADKLLVIGSVAKHNNPLWNEGLRFVMHQAKRDAAICEKLLEEDRLTAKDLKACEDDWKKNRGPVWDYLKDVHGKGSRLTNEQWDSLLGVLESVDDTLFIKICKSELTRMDVLKSSVKLTKLIKTWK